MYQKKRKMRKSVKPQCFGLRPLLVIVLTLCSALSVKAKNFEAQFPEELLSTRLKKISEKSGATVLFDPQLIGTTSIPSLVGENFSVEQALERSLSDTPFAWKKTAETSYAVMKKHTNQQQQKAQGKGLVSGKITDENGEPLPGVNIRPSGTNHGVMTDISGSYRLTLPVGTYTLEASCISFQSQKITDVEVNASKSTNLSFSLKDASTQLNDVLVTASFKKTSVENLYSTQRRMGLITNGISADLIARTPDKNVGESLRRISGITTTDSRYIVIRGLGERYNGNMLNGQLMPSTELNRKNFNFDILPSSIVDNITVVKTLTPDRSAEFGGGLVDVSTKDIPNEDFLQISIGSSINDKTTGKEFRSLQLDNNAYWGQTPENRKLLGSLNWNKPQEAFDAYDKAGNKASLFSNNWGLYKWNALPTINGQLSFGKVLDLGRNRKLGFIGAASYRNTLQTADIRTGRDSWANPTGNWKLGAQGKSYTFTTNVSALAGIGYRDQNTRVSLQQLYVASYSQQLAIVDYGKNNYGNWGYNDNTSQTSLWQTQLKAEQNIGNQGIKLNVLTSYVYMDRQRPDNHYIIAMAKVSKDDDSQVNIKSPGSTSMDGVLRMWTRAKESNLTWDANVFLPFTIAGSKQSFKAGYGGWFKDRTMSLINASTANYNASAYYTSLSTYFGPDTDTKIVLNRRFNDGYQRSAPLHAPYLMLDNRLGDKLRLVWGVRAESYDIDKLNTDTTSHISVGKKLNFFPSANLTYSFIKQMNLRAGYSRSIIRPDLRELANFNSYDYELGGSYYARALRYTFIDNYDFRYEWYPSAGEIVSISAFYKRIDYPMEIVKDYSNAEFILQNSREAMNYGLEFEVRKKLSVASLPILKDITLTGNLTLIKGKVKPMFSGYAYDENTGKTSFVTTIYDWQNRLQQGASRYSYNLGVYYDGSRLSASVLYNKMSIRSTLRIGKGSDDDMHSYNYYEDPASSLDAQIAVKLLKSKKLELKLSASNLLDSYSVTYQAENTPEKYDESKHEVLYRTANGRSSSFTVSYKF